MRAYISISYSRRHFMDETVRAIVDTLSAMDVDSFVFVDRYHFSSEQENEMMGQAFTDIEKSGLLIAETSEKAIGVGIEVGYAKGKQKPVIYMRQSEAQHSTTAAGASDYQVVYKNTEDLQFQLKNILRKLVANNRSL